MATQSKCIDIVLEPVQLTHKLVTCWFGLREEGSYQVEHGRQLRGFQSKSLFLCSELCSNGIILMVTFVGLLATLLHPLFVIQGILFSISSSYPHASQSYSIMEQMWLSLYVNIFIFKTIMRSNQVICIGTCHKCECILVPGTLTPKITPNGSFKLISAIYKPGAPPPSIPVLTYQSEFMSPPNESPSIFTQDVPTEANKQPPSWNTFENPPTKEIYFTSPAESSESNGPQSGPDDGKSILSDKEDDDLIPKPQGEAWRPNCGGYNLKLELSWDVKCYCSLKVSTLF